MFLGNTETISALNIWIGHVLALIHLRHMMTPGNEQHVIALGTKSKAFLKGISTVRRIPENGRDECLSGLIEEFSMAQRGMIFIEQTQISLLVS
jgi:hypothetical protein